MRRVPWLLLGGLPVMLGLWLAGRLGSAAALLPGCAFKRVTGLACATCGLTRCVLALGHGEWLQALHWHPGAAGLVLSWPLLVLWDLRRAWRGEPYPALPDSGQARLLVWVCFFAIWALQVARGI